MTYKIRSTIAIRLAIIFIMIFALLGYLSTSFLYKEYLKQFRVDFFNIVSSYAADIDGHLLSVHQRLIATSEVFPKSSLSDRVVLQHWLDDRRGLLETFDNGLFVFNTNGELIAESPLKPHCQGHDYRSRQYYQQTIETAKPFISAPIYLSEKDNHPSIMMTVPVFDAENRLVAIFSGALDLLSNNFLGKLPKLKLGKEGYFFLVSTNREIIAHPDSARIMKKDIPAGVNPLLDKALQGVESCDVNINSKGLKAVSAFKKLSSTNWVLGGNYPLKEIRHPLNASRRLVWLFIGGAFLFVFLCTIFTLKSVFTPLFSFVNHLATLSSKKGKDRLFVFGDRCEFSILAETFNRMIQNLDEIHFDLNHGQEMAHLGSWRWDAEKKELTWSDEVFRIIGDLPQSYQPSLDYFIDKIHPDDCGAVNIALCQSMKHLTPFEIEHRIIDSKGQVKYVREQGEYRQDSMGNAVGMVGTIQDITDVILLQKQLENLATTDDLTGAVNRRQLFSYVDQFCQLAKRYETPLSVIFFDLDHFKAVNDTYGHAAGDEVLQKTTDVVQSLLRDTDILARYGGEEFCILVPETDRDNACQLAERIRQAVAESSVELRSGETLQVTVSMGVATYCGNEQASALVDRADQGAYEAKQNGRNCVVCQ